MGLKFFTANALMAPAPARNFSAVAAVSRGPSQGWEFYYGRVGQSGGYEWAATNDGPPRFIGGVTPATFANEEGDVYVFGRPSQRDANGNITQLSPEEGWVYTDRGWMTGHVVSPFGFPISNLGGELVQSVTVKQAYAEVEHVKDTIEKKGGAKKARQKEQTAMSDRSTIVDALFTKQPVITRLAARFAALVSTVKGAASVATIVHGMFAIVAALREFAAVQSFVGSVGLAALMGDGEDANDGDIIRRFNCLTVGPAATTALNAFDTLMDDLNAAEAAGALADVTPVVVDHLRALKAFNTSIGGILGGLGSSATLSPVIVLAFSKREGGELPMDALMEAAVLGPAITAFNAAIDDCIAAVEAAAAAADVGAALGDLLTAAGAWCSAQSSLILVGAIGH